MRKTPLGRVIALPLMPFRGRLLEWLYPGHFCDLQMGRLIRQVLDSDSYCVDVGSHRGFMLESMIQAAPRGRFWAYEPIDELRAFAARRVRFDPRVVFSGYALSDRSGKRDFHQFSGEWSGFSGLRECAYSSEIARERVFTVEARALDDIYSPTDRLDLMKIDVEGGELDVLKGAQKTISRNRPIIIFEFHKLGASTYGLVPSDLWNWFQSMGDWRLMTLQGALSGKPFASLEEFVRVFNEGKHINYVACPADERLRRLVLSPN